MDGDDDDYNADDEKDIDNYFAMLLPLQRNNRPLNLSISTIASAQSV